MGTCHSCALEAHKGFSEMSKGRFKQGMNKVLDVKFARDPSQKESVDRKIQDAMKHRKKKIRKKLEKQVKKGKITREQMEEGLKQFEENYDESKKSDTNESQ